MTDKTRQTPTPSTTGPADASAELTGQSHVIRNVLASWAGHVVFVITGFILPRLIDGRVGQDALGVWDFGWSLVAYFGLVSGGVMSSVSRYVARHRAQRETEEMNVTVNTGLAIYLLTGGLVLLLTIVTTLLVPSLFGARFGQLTPQAQCVTLLLGLSLVGQFVFAVFNGVITGCHRWGLHNAIGAGAHLVSAGGMITILCLGGGLPGMAAVVLAGEALAGVLRWVAAHRVCPGLCISLRLARLRHARELIWFGGKTVTDSVARIVLYQTSPLLIVGFMGPAALALYARSASLIRHATTFLNKFAYVLTPTASAMQAAAGTQTSTSEDTKPLQELLVKGTRYSLYIGFPMIIVLAILGKSVLQLWMGERYAYGTVLAILAVGHLAPLSQRVTYHVLMGMGRHGLPAIAMLGAAVVAAVLTVLFLGSFQWGLEGAALAIVLPLTIVNAVVVPAYACRVLSLPYTRYLAQVLPGPIFAAAPLALWLWVARAAWDGSAMAVLAWGLGIGFIITAPIYWHCIVPPSLRQAVADRFAGTLRRLRVSQAGSP